MVTEHYWHSSKGSGALRFVVVGMASLGLDEVVSVKEIVEWIMRGVVMGREEMVECGVEGKWGGWEENGMCEGCGGGTWDGILRCGGNEMFRHV